MESLQSDALRVSSFFLHCRVSGDIKHPMELNAPALTIHLQRSFRDTNSTSSIQTSCKPYLGISVKTRPPTDATSDKAVTPTYRLEKAASDADTQVIVFTAGPPYEDIAFRIVKKPWEFSHRRGFRSTFDRGVLQRAFVRR